MANRFYFVNINSSESLVFIYYFVNLWKSSRNRYILFLGGLRMEGFCMTSQPTWLLHRDFHVILSVWYNLSLFPISQVNNSNGKRNLKKKISTNKLRKRLCICRTYKTYLSFLENVNFLISSDITTKWFSLKTNCEYVNTQNPTRYLFNNDKIYSLFVSYYCEKWFEAGFAILYSVVFELSIIVIIRR